MTQPTIAMRTMKRGAMEKIVANAMDDANRIALSSLNAFHVFFSKANVIGVTSTSRCGREPPGFDRPTALFGGSCSPPSRRRHVFFEILDGTLWHEGCRGRDLIL